MNIKGLNKSMRLADLQDGDSPFARNVILSKNDSVMAISNEEGLFERYEHDKGVIGVITTNDGRDIIFSGSKGSARVPEIGIYQNGVYTTFLIDNNLGFMNPIEGTYYYNNLGELIISWWDGVYDNSTKVKILNIDCPPFKISGLFTLINASDIALLDLTVDYTVPNYDLNKVNDNGGQLETGAYFFTFAHQFADSSIGNFKNLSLPVFINKDISEVYNNFNGNIGNQVTTKSITINIGNIPTYVKKITLGVVKKLNGITTAITIPNILVINGIVNYTYTGFLEYDSSLDEVLIPTASIIKAQGGAQVDNRLYLANVTQATIPNIQPYVNGIQVKWVFEDVLQMSEKTGSLKDMNFIFDKRQFKSNEVYALYLIGHISTGEQMAFHIPGRVVGNSLFLDDDEGNTFTVNENSLISSVISQHPASVSMLQALSINSNARVHEIFNTANADGTMGYWENQDEIYEDNDCSDVLDEDNVIQFTLRNNKVRHHRFPSLSQLKTFTGTVVNGTELADLIFLRMSVGVGDGGLPGMSLTNTLDVASSDFVTIDPLDATNKTFILTKECNLRLKFKFDSTGLASVQRGIIQIEHISKKPTIVFRYESNGSGTNISFLHYINIRGKVGDKIKLSVDAFTTGLVGTTTYLEFQDWNFERLNASSNLLGVRLENISIPATLRSKFTRFELGFAERTNENSTIVSTTHVQGATSLRIKPFDLFTFRASPSFDYIESHLAYKREEGVPELVNEVLDWGIRKATENQYVQGYTNGVEDNTLGEEYMYTKVLPGLVIPSGFVDFYRYADLKRYKNSVYFNRSNQKIVNTNQYVEQLGSISNNLYSGDTFFNMVGWYENTVQTSEQEEANIAADIFWAVPLKEEVSQLRYLVEAHIFPLETVANSGWMSQELDARYALSHPDMVKPAIYVFDNNATIDPPSKYLAVQFSQTENKWGYNKDYHSLLNLITVPIYECNGGCNEGNVDKFPYRIYRSAPYNKDNNDLNWRSFSSGDYFEIVKNKGVIWLLRAMEQSLLIHTLQTLFVASDKDKLETNVTDVFLGTGDIFDRAPSEIVSTTEGYGGCQNKFAAFICKIGYVFPDLQQGKWFVFNGELKELSDERTRNYLRDVFKSGFIGDINDNPFNGSGLTAAFDERHERIIVSRILRNDNAVFLKTLTMSYSILNNSWIAEHDYKPSYFYFNRKGLFSIDNGFDGILAKFYDHNQANLARYYGNILYPSFVDIAIKQTDENKLWTQVMWESYVVRLGIIQDDSTFSHLAVYNDFQCTGLIVLKKFAQLGFPSINARKHIQEWSFNQLSDIASPNTLFVKADGSFDTSILNANKSWHTKSRIMSKVIILRLYHDNINQNNISLHNVNGMFTKIER